MKTDEDVREDDEFVVGVRNSCSPSRDDGRCAGGTRRRSPVSALYAPLTRRISSLVDSLAVRLSQIQALDVSCDLMKVLVAKREEMLDYAHKVFLDELASLYTNETRWAPFFLYQYAITHIPPLVRILSLLTTSYARTLETRTWRDYTHGGAVTGSKEP